MRLANSAESIFSNSDNVEMAELIEPGWVDMESSLSRILDARCQPQSRFLNSTRIEVVIESSLGDCPGLESPIRDDADIPLSKSGTAIWNRPLPSSAGQVSTGPAIVNQLGLFLPSCPITARYNVIPAGYHKQLPADSSHKIFVDHAAARMRRLLRRRGLRKTKSIDESARKCLAWP
jgi:hypothetical protein